MGAESVLALMDAVPDSPALIISLDGNQVVRKQLMQCVEKVLYMILTSNCYPHPPIDIDALIVFNACMFCFSLNHILSMIPCLMARL